MKDNKMVTGDEDIRRAIKMSKKSAPDNFKHRVMHQIIQEDALKRENKTVINTNNSNVIRNFIGVFGGMYAVLILLLLGAYFVKGKEFMLSTQFIYIVLTVCVVFAVFCLITTIDGRLRRRL